MYATIHTYKKKIQRATNTSAQPYTKEASARNPGRPAAWRAQPVESLVSREPYSTSLYTKEGPFGDSGLPASTRYSRNAANMTSPLVFANSTATLIYKRRSV